MRGVNEVYQNKYEAQHFPMQANKRKSDKLQFGLEVCKVARDMVSKWHIFNINNVIPNIPNLI
jgi:hypothetical protein